MKRHILKRSVQHPSELNEILEQLSVQDWYILKRIMTNVNPQKFDVILQQVKDALAKRQVIISGGGGQAATGVTLTTSLELAPIK